MESQDEPTVVCSNCEKSIPESKSFLHEAYCFRHNVRCPKCNEPVHKEELEEHHRQFHQLLPCKYCKKDFEAKSLANHEENCFQKPKFCQFCKCEISNDEYSDHIYQCGSRTRKCTFCNQNILVRDLDSHEAACEVEQFTRGTSAPYGSEENKNNYLEEEMYSRPKRKDVYGESKQVFKKKIEPSQKPDLTKKRLTKLSEANRESNYNPRTQEEVDEDIERLMAEEPYGGRRKNPERNKGKYERQKTQEEIDEELANELNREYYEGRKDKEKPNVRKPKKKYYGEDSEDDDKAKRIDDEFFGLRRKSRGRMEIEKSPQEEEDEDEAYAKKLQEEFDRGSRPQQQKTTKYEREESPEEENYYYDEDIEEISESTNLDKPSQKSKPKNVEPAYQPEDFNYENDDPELQKAIQASLNWN